MVVRKALIAIKTSKIELFKNFNDWIGVVIFLSMHVNKPN